MSLGRPVDTMMVPGRICQLGGCIWGAQRMFLSTGICQLGGAYVVKWTAPSGRGSANKHNGHFIIRNNRESKRQLVGHEWAAVVGPLLRNRMPQTRKKEFAESLSQATVALRTSQHLKFYIAFLNAKEGTGPR